MTSSFLISISAAILLAGDSRLFVNGFLAAPRTKLLKLDLAFGGLAVLAGIVITPVTDGTLEPD